MFRKNEFIKFSDDEEEAADAPTTAVGELRHVESTMSNYDSLMKRISENAYTNRDMLNQFLGVRPKRARSSKTIQEEQQNQHRSRLQSAYRHDAEDPAAYIQEFDEWSQDARVPSVVHVIDGTEPVPASCTFGLAGLFIDAQGDPVPSDCLGFRPSRRHISVRGGDNKAYYDKSMSTPQTYATYTMDGSNQNHGGVLASLGCVLGSPRNDALRGGTEKEIFAKKPTDNYDDDSSLKNKAYWDKRAKAARGVLDRL